MKNPEELLQPVLLQLCVIILAARVFAGLFRRLGQPAVVGEIVAGLLLGPSCFQRLAPGLWNFVFAPRNPAVAGIMETLSQLGLIFLLFLIGLEFDFSHLRRYGRAAMGISIAGMATPFATGAALAWWMLPRLPAADAPANHLGFYLFMGTAMSITAIPILGRMMMELNITRTRLGAVAITAAALDDAVGWILLATVTAVVKAGAGADFSPWLSLRMLLETAGFFLFVILAARPLILRWVNHTLARNNGVMGVNALAVVLAILLLCAMATSAIGIFAIFGAFILGAALSTHREFRAAVSSNISTFVTAFFLPIFFTYTGLRTRIGVLDSSTLWVMAALVVLVAGVGKYGGCTLAARVSGFSWREASCIGVMMNTRALMELIVIDIGYDLKAIPASVFCMLVVMAVATTVVTTPFLLRNMRETELEPHIAQTGFVRRRAGTASQNKT